MEENSKEEKSSSSWSEGEEFDPNSWLLPDLPTPFSAEEDALRTSSHASLFSASGPDEPSSLEKDVASTSPHQMNFSSESESEKSSSESESEDSSSESEFENPLKVASQKSPQTKPTSHKFPSKASKSPRALKYASSESESEKSSSESESEYSLSESESKAPVKVTRQKSRQTRSTSHKLGSKTQKATPKALKDFSSKNKSEKFSSESKSKNSIKATQKLKVIELLERTPIYKSDNYKAYYMEFSDQLKQDTTFSTFFNNFGQLVRKVETNLGVESSEEDKLALVSMETLLSLFATVEEAEKALLKTFKGSDTIISKEIHPKRIQDLEPIADKVVSLDRKNARLIYSCQSQSDKNDQAKIFRDLFKKKKLLLKNLFYFI